MFEAISKKTDQPAAYLFPYQTTQADFQTGEYDRIQLIQSVMDGKAGYKTGQKAAEQPQYGENTAPEKCSVPFFTLSLFRTDIYG